MKSKTDEVSAKHFDEVIHLLEATPSLALQDIACQVGLSARTVRRIATGKIERPNVVVLERLSTPRRCGNCGRRCTEWPCISCEMAKSTSTAAAPRFVYA
jgi:hypothetical protein